MNQFFEGLANQNNAKVTSEVKGDNSSITCAGYLTLTKGIISMEISYWSGVHKTSYNGYAGLDDVDWNTESEYVNGIPVDSLNKFRDSLTSMGLSRVSDSMVISDKEIINEIAKAIESSDLFNYVYKDYKLFELQSDEKQKEIVLDYAIENYDKITTYTLYRYGLCNSRENEDKPTLEELIKIKEDAGK